MFKDGNHRVFFRKTGDKFTLKNKRYRPTVTTDKRTVRSDEQAFGFLAPLYGLTYQHNSVTDPHRCTQGAHEVLSSVIPNLTGIKVDAEHQ